jgi:hypothetical protein
MPDFYARGTVARRAREAAAVILQRGIDPGAPCGYYRVREGESWRVARWMPKAQRWEVGGGFVWPVGIGMKSGGRSHDR